MSSNHHTPIVSGAPATPSTFNGPLGELDAAISSLQNIASNSKIGFSDEALATISGSEFSATLVVDSNYSLYRIDSNITLVAVSGGTEGQVIIIRPATGRKVTINTSATLGGVAGRIVYLQSEYETAMFYRVKGTTRWQFIAKGSSTSFSASRNSNAARIFPTDIRLPFSAIFREDSSGAPGDHVLAVATRSDVRQSWGFRANNISVLPENTAAPTVANSPTNANDSVSTFVDLPSTASAGNLGGFVTPSFNLVRFAHSPFFSVVVQMPATITNMRVWIGLTSADVTNVDTLAASTKFLGFRYSTVAGDTVWQAVGHDGTTQSTIPVTDAFVQAGNTYRLECTVEAGTIYMRVATVNNFSYIPTVAVPVNRPADADNLGFVCRVIPTTASIRSLKFSRMICEHN